MVLRGVTRLERFVAQLSWRNELFAKHPLLYAYAAFGKSVLDDAQKANRYVRLMFRQSEVCLQPRSLREVSQLAFFLQLSCGENSGLHITHVSSEVEYLLNFSPNCIPGFSLSVLLPHFLITSTTSLWSASSTASPACPGMSACCCRPRCA